MAADKVVQEDPGVFGPDTVQPADLALGGLDEASPHDLATYAFTVLQAARLRAYLRNRTPDASVGSSILIFALSAAELHAALTEPPAELRPDCWSSDRNAAVAALVRRGDALLDDGRSAEAIPLLIEACGIDDVHPVAWGRLALAYAGSGREEDAVKAFQRAIRLAPKSAEPLYNRGNFHVERGRIAAGIADYDAAIIVDPDFRQAYFNRGVVMLRTGKKRESIADFARFRDLGGELPAVIEPLLENAGPERRP
jgi:tetratricopeptide (TPR) repeat protein